MDTEDVQRFIAILNRTDVALGMSSLDYLPFESSARINARRSLVAVRKICKGEVLASDMLTFKRPGTGVSPANLMDIIGKVAAADIDADTPITFADIDRRDVSA
jgi:N-acetylneuraminate synthase